MLYNFICQILFPLYRTVFTTLQKFIRYNENMVLDVFVLNDTDQIFIDL